MEILNDMRLIVTLALFIGINCSSVLKPNGTAGEDLNGQTLIALGKELNNSLITVIGKVIENYHNCTWSEWTECGARRPNFFSTRTRTGHCGIDKLGADRRVETEICEGKNLCPSDYNTTENGFCLKLYTKGTFYDDAHTICKDDGGFLINIDSDTKYADVKAFLTANDLTTYIHINGRRQNTASLWEYSYGQRGGYFHWFSGYPKSDANYLCLALSGNRTITGQSFLMFNNPCSYLRPFLCEIPA